MMASMGSDACADVDASLVIVNGADDESSLRRGWDGLARPALDETGRVRHSPISPMLARALQYFDEMPDSADSGGNAEEYVEDEECLAEDLKSADVSPSVRHAAHVCPEFPFPQHSPAHLSHRPLLRKKRSVWTARKRMEVALYLESRERREGILAPEEHPHTVTQAVFPS